MGIENHNIDELPQNEGKEKKDIQKYTPHINKEIEQNSMKAQQKDSLEADRLIASVDFNVSKGKEISEGKVNFTIIHYYLKCPKNKYNNKHKFKL